MCHMRCVVAQVVGIAPVQHSASPAYNILRAVHEEMSTSNLSFCLSEPFPEDNEALLSCFVFLISIFFQVKMSKHS